MYLRVPLYKYKLCTTYEYLYISISFVVLKGTFYKYKLCSTYGYLYISISSVTPTGNLNKYKSAISTSITSVVLTGTSI